jgi:hypothetical protein
MTAAPRVSVVLPAFNASATLELAIKSVLSGTFASFELVAINDGSSDDTGKQLRDWAARDPRIRVLEQTNQGLIAALNRGLREARCDLVARMDQDDVALPGRLAHQVAFLDANPGVVAVGGAIRLFGANGVSETVIRHPTTPEGVRTKLRHASALAHPTVLMRRAAALAAGGYRRPFRHAEDYDLWLRLAERANLANLEEVVLLYRVSGSQSSVAHARQQVVSEIGARIAADERQAGRADPTDGLDLMSEAWLASRNVDRATLDRKTIDRLVFQIWLLRTVGDPHSASEVLGRLEGLDVGPRLLSHRSAEAEWAGLRLAIDGNRRGTALTMLLRFALRHPREALHRGFALVSRVRPGRYSRR